MNQATTHRIFCEAQASDQRLKRWVHDGTNCKWCKDQHPQPVTPPEVIEAALRVPPGATPRLTLASD